MQIRAASAGDAEFLADMLVEAANWPSHTDRGRAETLADPNIAHYIDGWPLPGDVGVVAVDDGRRLGAAWLRFFPDEDPAYGFVRADIPELAIGVVPDSRGNGVGRALLRALHAEARDRGIAEVSLSVETANAAAQLYASEGYRVVDSRDHADTMLLAL